jgi:hypothetical protein
MNWQIRYLMKGGLATCTVCGLDAALDEAGRLLEAGCDVRRIEAPSAGCALPADTIRRLCAQRPSVVLPADDRFGPADHSVPIAQG